MIWQTGVNTFINPQYTRLTGYTLADLQDFEGCRIFALFHPEDQERVAAHMERIGRAGDDETLEIEYRFKTRRRPLDLVLVKRGRLRTRRTRCRAPDYRYFCGHHRAQNAPKKN